MYFAPHGTHISTSLANMDKNMNEKNNVRFNLRGFVFEVDRKCVESHPNSRLYELSHEQRDNDNPIYLNRDPFVFNAILDYYVTGKMHVDGTCANKMKDEFEFWGLRCKDLCLRCMKQHEEALHEGEELSNLIKNWVSCSPSVQITNIQNGVASPQNDNKKGVAWPHNNGMKGLTSPVSKPAIGTRERLYDFLEGQGNSFSSKVSVRHNNI